MHPAVGPISSGILAFPGTEIDKILAIIPVCTPRPSLVQSLIACPVGMEEDTDGEGALYDELL